MELPNTFKKGASAPENEDDPIGHFLRHIGAENLAYAIVRSLILTRPIQLRGIFNLIHALPHSLAHNRSKHKQADEKYPILAYWQEKPSICEPCTSFLSELLTSSWRIYGPEIARSHQLGVPLWAESRPDSVTIMANLFNYMNTAYARIERETKAALQAKSHSSAFADACSEYFGENYEITNEPQRLKDLLLWLHQDTAQSLIQRLIGGEYIANCLEADKKELSQKPDLEEKLAPRFIEDTKSQKEQGPAQHPVRGKLYESNKKKTQRKKRQKALMASNNQVEVSNDSTNISERTEAQSLMSLEQNEGPILKQKTAMQESHPSAIGDIITADATVSKEPADANITKDHFTISPTAIQTSLKEEITLSKDRGEAPRPNTPTPDTFNTASNQSIATPVQNPHDIDFLDQYEHYHRLSMENAANDKWTEVKGSRKKSKKSDKSSANATISNMSPAKRTPVVAQRVKNQTGHEKLGASPASSVTPTRIAKITAPLQKGRTLSNSSPSASGSKSSEPKESPSKAVVPSAAAKCPWSASTTATPTVPPKSFTSEKLAISNTPASSERTTITKKLVDVEKSAIIEKPVGKEKSTSPRRPVRQEKSTDSEEQAESHTQSTSEKQVFVTQKTVVSQKKVVSKKTIVTQKTVITEKTVVSQQPDASGSSTAPEDIVSRSADSITDITESNPESTNLKPDSVKEPLASTTVVDNSRRDTKERCHPSATESIDPGTRPNYRFLQPFSKRAKRAKIYENMAPTTRVSFAETASNNNARSLLERLRHARVQYNALTSLAPRSSAIAPTSTHLAPPNFEAAQRRAFPGRLLDVTRANNHSTSAGNSPIPEQEEQPVIYHYPPPDVLSPENQEILDLIIKGPPYPKYPRVPKLPSRDDIQLVPAVFATKKVTVTTYDGKDVYDVLGDRCPDQLTIKDHPDVNKCIRDGQIFHCAYCGVDISGTAAAENIIICPGCGPCSSTRYCRRSHLLADSMKHFEICGKKAESYPLQWSELPLHYQSLYPYIEPINGNMTVQCFRQMAHCLIVNSDGIIQHPFLAYYAVKMPMDERVITFDWVKAMYPFQDKGHYYIFHPCRIAAGVDIDMAICMPDGSSGCFREDQRFQRVRNAAFLTQDQSLLCVIYRRLQDALMGKFDLSDEKRNNRLGWLAKQFCEEFPSFKLMLVAPLQEDYSFQTDWIHVRNLVADLELANPILRAWIAEDEEDDGVPADPTARWQGKHWGIVIDGPTFRAGSVDRKDWGPGWHGGGPFDEDDEQVWMKELNRKYFNMVLDELAKVELERDGEII